MPFGLGYVFYSFSRLFYSQNKAWTEEEKKEEEIVIIIKSDLKLMKLKNCCQSKDEQQETRTNKTQLLLHK